jgi:hypothetical protein
MRLGRQGSGRRVSRVATIAGGGLLIFALFLAAACDDGDNGNGIDLPDMEATEEVPGLNGTDDNGIDPLTPEAPTESPSPTATSDETSADVESDGAASFTLLATSGRSASVT